MRNKTEVGVNHMRAG